MTWLFALLLGVFSAVAIVGNWQFVLMALRSPDGKGPSLIPFLGGLAGVVALLLTGEPSWMRWCWVPLVLDWGSGLGLLAAPWLYWRWRRRQPNRGNTDASKP